MFKKATSNTDKDSPSTNIIQRYPRITLALMIILMLCSCCYLLLIKEPKEKNDSATRALMEPLNESFNGIFSSGAALGELIVLEQQLQEMLQKDSLDAADSAKIERALDKMLQLQHQLGAQPEGDPETKKPNTLKPSKP